MRRKAGIAIGACTALVLSGVAGVTAWSYAGNDLRPIGTWHEAPGAARTPVAEQKPAPNTSESSSPSAEPQAAAGETAAEGATPTPTSSESTSSASTSSASTGQTDTAAGSDRTEKARVVESASGGGGGRQRVGELVPERRLLDYTGSTSKKETFRYPGASYVKLHFGRMTMLPGDYLTVTSGDGAESYRYNASDTGSANRWAMSVTGDTAVVEMHRAGRAGVVGSSAGKLGVDVDRVARGFSRTEQDRQPEKQILAPGRTGREESVCGSDTSSDAVCYKSADPVAYTKSKAIARLLINGTELCTGWRIGASNRMLTNNHCFTNTAEAYNTEVWFNYQCATCGGYDVFQPTKVWGDKVLATDHVYDYTLFSVSNFASVKKFGYLVLDTARPVVGQELYVPQHPAGQPAKIAGSLGEKAGNCSVTNPAYDGYGTGTDVAYLCDTEGGSSGSPVISRRTNKVVALHHFGGCPNSGVRGDLLAAKLRSYL